MRTSKPIEPHEVGQSWADSKAHGLRYYLSGLCKNGNVAPRYTNGGGCLCAQCRADRSKRSADWNKDNADRYAATQQRHQGKPEYRERARPRAAAYRKQNAERITARVREWQLSNPDRVAAIRERRNAAQRRATPPWWSDWDVFVQQEAQELAQQRTALTGIAWEVDHLIPIQGQGASGLHCAANLQVIPRLLNHWKKDRLLLTERGEWIKHI